MPKVADPFDLILSLRDRIQSDGVDAALREIAPDTVDRGDRRAFDRARTRFYSRDPAAEDVGQAVAKELLPPLDRRVDTEADSDDLPTILRALQEILLAHPVAGRRFFAALVAEGDRFARTSEGRAWAERLAESELVEDARLVFQMTSLSLLEQSDAPDRLPSAYLDAFFRAAAHDDTDALLDRLFGGGGSEGHDAGTD